MGDENNIAKAIEHKPVKSLWLMVDYNEDYPYRIKLDTGNEVIPIIGHGHHNLTWALKSYADECMKVVQKSVEMLQQYGDKIMILEAEIKRLKANAES